MLKNRADYIPIGNLLVLMVLLWPPTSHGDCSRQQAQESVNRVCEWVDSMGKGALKKVQLYRYCGSNYVWVQSSDLKMVIHPIKRRLKGRSLKYRKDKKGKFLFVAFDKKAKLRRKGGWVSYFWTRPGDEHPTPKTSFVKMCPGPLKWIAGSGIWRSEEMEE